MAVTLPNLTVELIETNKDSIEDLFYDFKIQEEEYKEINGKYKQVMAQEQDGVKQEVHEYVCLDGSVGYQVYLSSLIDGEQMSTSFGVGPESGERSFDWVMVQQDSD